MQSLAYDRATITVFVISTVPHRKHPTTYNLDSIALQEILDTLYYRNSRTNNLYLNSMTMILVSIYTRSLLARSYK